jgi:hypothetical protein
MHTHPFACVRVRAHLPDLELLFDVRQEQDLDADDREPKVARKHLHDVSLARVGAPWGGRQQRVVQSVSVANTLEAVLSPPHIIPKMKMTVLRPCSPLPILIFEPEVAVSTMSAAKVSSLFETHEDRMEDERRKPEVERPLR